MKTLTITVLLTLTFLLSACGEAPTNTQSQQPKSAPPEATWTIKCFSGEKEVYSTTSGKSLQILINGMAFTENEKAVRVIGKCTAKQN